MFQQPNIYPLVPQKVKSLLRQIQGVTIPHFIKGENIEVLADIQVVQVDDVVIPIYPTIEDAWVDVVYDCWIEVGKIDSPQIEQLATDKILTPTWWTH